MNGCSTHMREKSRTEYSLINISVGLGGYALNTILGLVCRVIFTRTLTSEYLGISGLFTNILTMLSLAELGIGSAITYALYKPLAIRDEQKVASLVKFYGKCYRIIGCVVALIGVVIIPFLNLIIQEKPNIKENLQIIFLIYLYNAASTYFFSYRSALLAAAQQNYLVTGINYLITIIQSVVQVAWLLLTREYLGYLIIQSIGTLVYNITISYVAKKRFPYISNSDVKSLTNQEKSDLSKNIRALVVWKLSGILVNSTDNIIITYFRGLSSTGLLSNYTLLSGTLNSVLNQIFNGLTASIGNFNATESDSRKLKIFKIVNLSNFWLFGWASIGIAVLSTDVVRLLFGNSYTMSQEIPLIIGLNFYMVGMQNAVWAFKNTMGLFRPGRYLLILTAVINLAASICLGNIFGIFGILLATAIARVLTNTWYDPYVVFKYGLKMDTKIYFYAYFKYALLIIFAGTLCYFVCAKIDINPFVNVIFKSILCSAIANLVFWIAFRKSESYNYLRGKIVDIAKRAMKKIFRAV